MPTTIFVRTFKSFATSKTQVHTSMASLAAVPWWNCNNLNSINQSLVLQKSTKLVESPRVRTETLFFASWLLISVFSNSCQVFQNKLGRISLENKPQITAQVLILRRLPPETAWSQLAEEYGVAAGTLSSFYQRKCKPLLREFSKSQGYI